MSSGALSKERLSRLHEVMASHVEQGEVPGVVTLISRMDDVHVLAVGSRDLASRIPMRRDTIFRIASMTKPVTAVAAVILVEEARLRLDDPVDRWLPELAGRNVLAADEGYRVSCAGIEARSARHRVRDRSDDAAARGSRRSAPADCGAARHSFSPAAADLPPPSMTT